MSGVKVIDVTGRLSAELVELLAAVSAVAAQRGMDLIMIGAIARDFITHHLWGENAGRATKDIDFAVNASSWDEYTQLKKTLVEEATFSQTKTTHQLERKGIKVDLVPFGAIAAPNQVLTWPPKGQPQMSTAGLIEAFKTALVFEHRKPAWKLRVPEPAAFIGLKVFAWSDRGHDKSKDAEDIDFVLVQASHVIPMITSLYDEHQAILELESFDTDLAIAHLLGRQAATLFEPTTRAKLVEVLAPETDAQRPSRLAAAMAHGHRPGAPNPTSLDRSLARLQALHRGLSSS